MSKLAGRMTYLGFGVLMGSSTIIGYNAYFGSEFNSTNTLQILIAALTAVTGCMSAYAAHQAATITRKTHDNAEKQHRIRVRSAKNVIKQTLNILQDPAFNRSKPLILDNIESYAMSCQVIEFALIEPMGDKQNMALWQAKATIQQMCSHHKAEEGLTPRRREWAEEMLSDALKAFPPPK